MSPPNKLYIEKSDLLAAIELWREGDPSLIQEYIRNLYAYRTRDGEEYLTQYLQAICVTYTNNRGKLEIPERLTPEVYAILPAEVQLWIEELSALPVVEFQGLTKEFLDEIWKVVKEKNTPPVLFRRNDTIVEIDPASGKLFPHDSNSWRTYLINHVRIVRPSKYPAAIAHAEVANAMLGEVPARWPLPELINVASRPFLSPSGQFVTTSGYDPESRIYAKLESTYLPVGQRKTAEEDSLRAYLDLLQDFQWMDEKDFSTAMAFLITPFVRSLIHGPTPMFIFESPMIGTGKTLLVRALSEISVGRESTTELPYGRNEEEFQKSLFGALQTGKRIIILDNATPKFRSHYLQLALTSYPHLYMRQLGANRVHELQVPDVWAMTVNNPEFELDLLRRAVHVRLQPDVAAPWQRKPDSFHIPNLLTHVRENVEFYVDHALQLISHWVTIGQPKYPDLPVLGGFEEFSLIVGSILKCNNILHFLEPDEEELREYVPRSAAEEKFVLEWAEQFKDQCVGLRELMPIARDKCPELLPNKEYTTDRGWTTALGMRLHEMRNRIYGTWRVTRLSYHGEAHKYRLIAVEPKPGAD